MVRDKAGEVILVNGGMLLAWVGPDIAKELVPQIEAAYPQKTTTVTITADWREVTEAPFGSLFRWAGTWLRRKKESRESVPFIEALPHVERCRSCQIRPAHPEYLDRYPDWPLCKVCYEKRAYRGRDLWFCDFQAFLDENQPLSTRYYQGKKPFPQFDAEREQARWTPQDLDEIGQACTTRPGYVGMIYLDGDGMGEVFENVPTREAFEDLSKAIRDAATSAVMPCTSTLPASCQSGIV
jgi:CRISPR/Cas system-associated protein Cas10 (large subunit of type III CRISPR-Cas system)